jgi:hypothetical protein
MAQQLTANDILNIHFHLVEVFAGDGDPIVPAGPQL